MAVLKFWDDPDSMFSSYLVKVRAEEKKKNMRSAQGEKAIEAEYDNRNVRGS